MTFMKRCFHLYIKGNTYFCFAFKNKYYFLTQEIKYI